MTSAVSGNCLSSFGGRGFVRVNPSSTHRDEADPGAARVPPTLVGARVAGTGRTVRREPCRVDPVRPGGPCRRPAPPDPRPAVVRAAEGSGAAGPGPDPVTRPS